MATGMLGALPLREDRFPAGAVFQLSSPFDRDAKVEIGGGDAELRLAAGSSHLVVRLSNAAGDHREARTTALQVAQRGLDFLSVQNVAHVAITALRNEESSFAWWTSREHGNVLRRTVIIPYDLSVLAKVPVLRKLRDDIAAKLPQRPPLAGPPQWHPSFRFYRMSQLSDDRIEAFRNMYLAVESLLDGVLPSGRSHKSNRHWMGEAVASAIDGVALGRSFGEGHPNQADYVTDVIYRNFRNATFHGRASQGVKLPHVESDSEAEDMEKALSDLGYLYVVLAKKHLGADFPVGFGVFRGGFEMMTEQLVGRLSIHVTDDVPPADPVNEEELNPRSARMYELRTRNAKKLEERFRRVFIGVGDPALILADVPTPRGLKASIGDVPFAWSDFEAPLALDGFNRFEVVLGVHGFNPTDRRRIFET